MDWLILSIVIVVVLVLVAGWLTSGSRATETYPYIKKDPLFSPAERSFLGVLDQAVGREYRILGKVRVADVVEPQRGLGRSTRQQALNRTNAKHFDFVLCAHDDLSVAGVIELDDRSHQHPRRQERDRFVASVCEAVSLPLVRIEAQRAYSVPEVRAKVLGALADVKEELTPALADAEPVTGAAAPHAPSCPTCSATMVRRRAKAGANAGQEFWGCSSFPKCRSVLPVNA